MIEHADKIALLVGNFGFPILVAVYLLIRFEKRLHALTGAIREHTIKIDLMNKNRES